MGVQIICRENIKPSSPTPQHLRNFKLSLLDQLIPSPYAPIVLFYPVNDSTTTILDTPKRLALLKQSLAETLTRFYPLAGKIKDDLSIECNDEGAYYVETRVNCSLADFLRQPDVTAVHQFLPCQLVMKESTAGTFVTNIQVNVFDCGGIAIGICISHKILDGASLSTFLKAWSAAALGGCEEKIIHPNFAANSLFPANDLWLRDTSIVMWGSLFIKGNCVTRRFVFDASAVRALRAKATSASVKSPTRVEAISAFIWKCAMAASKEKNGSQRPSLLSHLVNIRRRMVPPISEYSTGNLLWIAAAQCMASDDLELPNLAGEVRDSISKFDGDFVKKLTSDDGNCLMSESLKEIGEIGSKDGVDYFGFTSWCKLGFYETDFGWGKPIWVSSVALSGSVFMNLTILVETRSGDGIEAWMTLDEQDMATLASNPEFLKFASIDPSPLDFN